MVSNGATRKRARRKTSKGRKARVLKDPPLAGAHSSDPVGLATVVAYVTGVTVKPKDRFVMSTLSSSFCLLLCANAAVSPLKDSFGALNGQGVLSYLVMLSTFAMVLLNPVLTSLAGTLPRESLARVYMRGGSLACFVFLTAFLAAPGLRRYLAGAIFVYMNLQSVLSVSVLWGLSGELLDLKASRSYFALLSLAATVGHTVGSAFATFFATYVGNGEYLLLVSGIMLEGALAMFLRSSAAIGRGGGKTAGKTAPAAAQPHSPPQTPWFASAYALGIVGYTCFYSLSLTALFMERMAVLSGVPLGEKITAMANINFAASSTTMVLQIFVTGRLLQALPTSVSLAMLPVAFGAGFYFLFAHRSIAAVFFFEVSRRTLAFGFVKPVRELLYHGIPSKPARVSTKTFNDSVCRKVGDFCAPVYASATVFSRSWSVGGVIVLWFALSVALGKRFDDRLERGKKEGGRR